MLNVTWTFDEEFLPYSEMNKISYEKSGIYFLYNCNKQLLYIGIAKMLKKRIMFHFGGNGNTSAISKEFKYFSVIYERDQILRRLFEDYFIQIYNPPFNKTKNPRATCKGFKKDGSKCGMYAVKDGYCRHHANNGHLKI